MLAAQDGNAQLVRLLLKAGVDPELRDENPKPPPTTPNHYREADTLASGPEGYPLRFTRTGRFVNMQGTREVLDEYWWDVDNAYRWTALDYAKHSGNIEAIHLIETELQHRTCMLAFPMRTHPRHGVNELPIELTDMILEILQEMHDVDPPVIEDID